GPSQPSNRESNQEPDQPNKEPNQEVGPTNEDDEGFNNCDRMIFTKRFEAMDDRKKWLLKSGKFVEDVLYDLGMRCKFHNLVHSFIIDCEDRFVQSGFTNNELMEIREASDKQGEMQIDDELLNYISTFAKNSTEEIREALYALHPNLTRNYNPINDFKYEHIRTTVSDWVRLLEMKPNPLTMTNLPESWFRVNVWRTIDIAFSDIPFMFFVG
ncbi:20531_t:CDS:2, partial [Dentiscutata erythropus]